MFFAELLRGYSTNSPPKKRWSFGPTPCFSRSSSEGTPQTSISYVLVELEVITRNCHSLRKYRFVSFFLSRSSPSRLACGASLPFFTVTARPRLALPPPSRDRPAQQIPAPPRRRTAAPDGRSPPRADCCSRRPLSSTSCTCCHSAPGCCSALAGRCPFRSFLLCSRR